MLLVRHAAPSVSQNSEPLVRQFLKRSPESLIPETPRLPGLVCIQLVPQPRDRPTGRKRKRHALIWTWTWGLLDLVPWGLFWIGSDDGRPPTSSRLTESRTGRMTRGGGMDRSNVPSLRCSKACWEVGTDSLPHGALLFGGLGLTHWCSGAVLAVGIFGPGEELWLVTRRKGTRCLASVQQIDPSPIRPRAGCRPD